MSEHIHKKVDINLKQGDSISFYLSRDSESDLHICIKYNHIEITNEKGLTVSKTKDTGHNIRTLLRFVR